MVVGQMSIDAARRVPLRQHSDQLSISREALSRLKKVWEIESDAESSLLLQFDSRLNVAVWEDRP